MSCQEEKKSVACFLGVMHTARRHTFTHYRPEYCAILYAGTNLMIYAPMIPLPTIAAMATCTLVLQAHSVVCCCAGVTLCWECN